MNPPDDFGRCTGEIGVGTDRYCPHARKCQRYQAWVWDRENRKESHKGVPVKMAEPWPCDQFIPIEPG